MGRHAHHSAEGCLRVTEFFAERRRGRTAWFECIHMHAQLLWVGSHNVVSDSAGFSISSAVVLAKSPILFSNACFAKAVAIAHKLCRCLQYENRDRQTDRQTDTLTHRPSTVTLAAHARRGLIMYIIYVLTAGFCSSG